MATRRAIANGNWSATGTWNGGVVPTAGDTVYANGFNVTINQDINIGGVNNPTVNAGSFVPGQWYEIVFVGTSSFPGASSNTVGTIFLATNAGTGTGTAKAIATLTTAANSSAGAAAGGVFLMSTAFLLSTDLRAGTTTCLNVTGSTSFNLSGINIFGGSVSGAIGLNYAATGTATVTSSIVAGQQNGTAINNTSTGTLAVSSCTVTGGLGGGGTAITNSSTGTVTVSFCTVTGGNGGSSPAITNASTGTVTATSCTVWGGSLSVAFLNSSVGALTVVSSTIGAGGIAAAVAINNTSTGTLTISMSDMTASAFANAVTGSNTGAIVNISGNFYDHWQGIPAVYVIKWKLNTAPTLGQHRYALAGTTDSYFTMYGADNGSFGNPIAANVRSGVSYGGGNLTGTCAVPAAGSVSLGVPVDAGFGTAVLTPAAIRTELAVELARIDAAVSSRLAPSGTLATVTTLTNAPTVPTPAQIATQVRTELSSELAKVSALNTTRLGQVTTTEILGNLLSQANS
jgi:hypothetical protein